MAGKSRFLEESWKRKNEERSAGEVAEELARIAGELSRGEITISGEKLRVGDTFSFSVKKQLRKGVVSCEIFLQSSLAAHAPDHDDSSVSPVARQSKPLQNSGAPGGKKVKKEIGRLWKEVAKQVSANTSPSRVLSDELMKKCDEYNLCAGKEWFVLWRQCCDEVKACLVAAQKGDFAAATDKVDLVNRLTKECHKLYK